MSGVGNIISRMLADQGFLLQSEALMDGQTSSAPLEEVALSGMAIAAGLPADVQGEILFQAGQIANGNTEEAVRKLAQILEGTDAAAFSAAAKRAEAEFRLGHSRFQPPKRNPSSGVEQGELMVFSVFDAIRVMKELNQKYRSLAQRILEAIGNGEEGAAIAGWLEPELEELIAAAAGFQKNVMSLIRNEQTVPSAHLSALRAFAHEIIGRDLNVLKNSIGFLKDPEKKSKAVKWFREILSPVSDNVYNLLKQTFLKLRARAVQSGISLSVLIPGKPRFTEGTDLEKVRTVIENLVENGIKYCDPEKSERTLHFEYDPLCCTLTYRDNGIGMEPTFAARLGDRPIREERAEGVEGTGTGWTLIAASLRELGWEYEIETAPGNGLTLTIQMRPEHFSSV